MQIVIPMAGLGERFKFAGYKDPKPLIPIDGKPVIEHIVEMFSPEDKFVFICNENHLRDTRLKSELERIRPEAKIVSIKEHYLGPVYTTLQAKDYIDDSLETFTCYCDVNTDLNLDHFRKFVKDNNADSILIAFKGFHAPLLQDGFYATMKTDDCNNLLEVREKYSFTPNKMDSWTSAGMHYFRSGELLKKYFEKMMEREMLCNNEYYISLSHNLLIEDGLKNLLYPIEHFVSWGKPADVREYLYWSNYFNKKK